jgi:hypothetical protein
MEPTWIAGAIFAGSVKKSHYKAHMAIYDKPVRLLMKDMADAMNLQGDTVFTKQQAISWFKEHFPKIKEGTITAHLIRLSTNAPSRLHYNAKPVEDDVFFQIDGNQFRRYNASLDPAPISATSEKVEVIQQDEDTPAIGSSEFAYEADLKNYLAKNLHALEPGLSLFEDEGITGIEFPVGGRFIDILAVDSANDLVVIELKVSRGYDRVIGQLMRYMAWIQKNQAEDGQKVRGIIVARDISEDLVLACSLVANVELCEYRLSLTLNKIT